VGGDALTLTVPYLTGEAILTQNSSKTLFKPPYLPFFLNLKPRTIEGEAERARFLLTHLPLLHHRWSKCIPLSINLNIETLHQNMVRSSGDGGLN
jgi:hypothetical protein